MKNIKTLGIVLTRTNYSEADRIITFLTPDHGKVRALARGVRKQKSKLAGGIELFSISQLSFIVGRGEILTLTSSRLAKHFGNIVKDLSRTDSAYQLLKLINKSTEDAADSGYFILAENALASLDDPKLPLPVIDLWMRCRLIKLSGHSPNLKTDVEGNDLVATKKYDFDFTHMAFMPTPRARFGAAHIKYLRLNFGSNLPPAISRVSGAEDLAADCLPLADSIIKMFARN